MRPSATRVAYLYLLKKTGAWVPGEPKDDNEGQGWNPGHLEPNGPDDGLGEGSQMPPARDDYGVLLPDPTE